MKLYIKYDKSLQLKAKKIDILDKNITISNVDLSLDYKYKKFFLNVKNIQQDKFKTSFNTSLSINKIKKIISSKKAKLYLNDFIFYFDTKLAPIVATNAIIKYDKNLLITFTKPKFDSFDISNSSIVIDKDKIDISVFTNAILNEKLKNILKHYNIVLPITQIGGNNKTKLDILIFFNNNLSILLNTISKNTIIKYDDIKFFINDLKIKLKDNIVYISGNKAYQLKNNLYSLKNIKLKIVDNKIYIKTDILNRKNRIFFDGYLNLDNLIVIGKVKINYFKLDYLVIKNQSIDIDIKLQKLLSFIKSKQIKLNILNYLLSLKDLKIDYKNNNISFWTKAFLDKNSTILSGEFNLDKNNLNLKAKILNIDSFDMKIKDSNLTIKSDDLANFNIKSKKINLLYKNHPINIKNVDILANKSSIINNIKMVKSDINNHKIYIKNLSNYYFNNNLKTSFKFSLLDLKNLILVTNNFNTKDKLSDGLIYIRKFNFKNYINIENKSFDYNINLNDLNITTSLGNTIFYNNNVKSKNFEDILSFLPFIKVLSKNIFLKITDINNPDITVNNLKISINSKNIPKNKKDNNTSLPFYKFNFKLFNSIITYDNFDINIQSLIINSTKNNLVAYLKLQDNSNMQFKIDKKKMIISSNYFDTKLINRFLHKDIFNKGYIGFNIKSDYKKYDIALNLHKTYIKNVALLNNLIFFINSTPALINPLLALPTLYRSMQDEYSIKGYYIKKGFANITYQNNKVYINRFRTFSLLTDFDGRGLIDIDKEKINLSVKTIFLKDYTKVVKSIPVINYIALGDDGNFETTIDIRGNFEKQEFETHLVKEGSRGTVGVVKRVLETPFKILKDGVNFIFGDNNITK